MTWNYGIDGTMELMKKAIENDHTKDMILSLMRDDIKQASKRTRHQISAINGNYIYNSKYHQTRLHNLGHHMDTQHPVMFQDIASLIVGISEWYGIIVIFNTQHLTSAEFWPRKPTPSTHENNFH